MIINVYRVRYLSFSPELKDKKSIIRSGWKTSFYDAFFVGDGAER